MYSTGLENWVADDCPSDLHLIGGSGSSWNGWADGCSVADGRDKMRDGLMCDDGDDFVGTHVPEADA